MSPTSPLAQAELAVSQKTAITTVKQKSCMKKKQFEYLLFLIITCGEAVRS